MRVPFPLLFCSQMAGFGICDVTERENSEPPKGICIVLITEQHIYSIYFLSKVTDIALEAIQY